MIGQRHALFQEMHSPFSVYQICSVEKNVEIFDGDLSRFSK